MRCLTPLAVDEQAAKPTRLVPVRFAADAGRMPRFLTPLLAACATAAALAICMAGCGGGSVHHPKPAASHASMLFSQSAVSGTLKPAGRDRQLLTLHGVGRQTVWFQDRPGRNAGQTNTGIFVRAWGKLGFADDAPNAALVLLDAKDEEDTLVVELEGQPRYDPAGKVLRYTVRVRRDNPDAVRGLRGDASIPRTFTDASLFIDDSIVVVDSGSSGDSGSADLVLDPHLAFDMRGNLCPMTRINPVTRLCPASGTSAPNP
jgi:hypothetical protein